MNLRSRLAMLVLALLFLTAGSAGFAQQKNKFKLKPEAMGKLCLKCHVAFREKLGLPYVHTPVKKGNCSDCHNPHTSRYGKYMAAEAGKICIMCHGEMISDNLQSIHRVVVEGNCVKCHDPHASKNKFNLLQAGNDLCYGCHKGIQESVTGSRFKHSPVQKGCLTCHTPHSSARSASLLKNGVPALCTECHPPNKPAFARQHLDYPVGKARCTSCHAPHGSNRGGLLWENVHAPVVNKMCNQCHMDPSSPDAIKTRKSGFDLCRGCHSNMLNVTFDKNRIHWPLVEKAACLNCHTPHASRGSRLLKSSMVSLCGECHADTIERQGKSLVKHQPIIEGNCTKCHQPHSSNNVFLLDNTSTIDLCGTCHDWQKHTTHPIGEKIVDPRNRNLNLDCLSCHRSHGTDQKYFTYFDPKMDLCVQCHVQYKR